MTATVLALLGILTVAFALGLSVAVTMGLGGLLLAEFFTDRPVWHILGHIPWNVGTSESLVALPLFILMGEILMRSGITDRMYEALAKWLNPLPGGLLHTNVVACAVFSCISGSSSATAATISGVSLPAMRAHGYSERLALGSLAAGGTLGILIPPSITFIVYAVLVEESIGQLYLASILPGLIMTLAFMGVIFIAAKLNPDLAPRAESVPWRMKLLSLGALVPVAILMLLVLGTIYAGIATATEAAAFGVTGACATALIMRRLNFRMLGDALRVTAGTTAMIFFILIGAFVLQFVLAFLGIPAAMSRWIIGLGLDQVQVVLLICVVYLILGTFMEELSMIITTIPILVPLLKSLGVDLVWFGVIVVILVQAAIISPPVGMNLFILQGLRERLAGAGTVKPPISDVFLGVLPFFVAMLLTLALIIAVPQTALWIVKSSKAL
jgi:C4-dicarboxylate transporter, DctM subunit